MENIDKIWLFFGFFQKNEIWPYLVEFGLFLRVIWLYACAKAYQPCLFYLYSRCIIHSYFILTFGRMQIHSIKTETGDIIFLLRLKRALNTVESKCTIHFSKVYAKIINIKVKNCNIKKCICIVLVVQSLCERSKILDGEIEHAQQLAEWMEDKKFGWQLCYRASNDGWSGADFHTKCDDLGPTVTLVKCGTNVFGGYTDQSWEGILYTFSFLQSNYDV